MTVDNFLVIDISVLSNRHKFYYLWPYLYGLFSLLKSIQRNQNGFEFKDWWRTFKRVLVIFIDCVICSSDNWCLVFFQISYLHYLINSKFNEFFKNVFDKPSAYARVNRIFLLKWCRSIPADSCSKLKCWKLAS